LLGKHAGFELAAVISNEDLELAVQLMWAPVLARNPKAETRPDVTRQALTAALASDEHVVVAVTIEHAVVGLLWLHAWGDAHGVIVYVDEIMLIAELQGAGLGSRVMHTLEQAARQSGACALCLDFMASNARVRPFYERLGFRSVGYDFRKFPDANRIASPEQDFRPFDAARDRDSLARCVAEDCSLHRFEYPVQSSSAVHERLAEVVSGREQAIVSELVDGGFSYVWFEIESSRWNGKPFARIRALGAGRAGLRFDVVSGALGALERLAVHEGIPMDIYLTLWAPSPELVGNLEVAGYLIGRTKLSKILSENEPS